MMKPGDLVDIAVVGWRKATDRYLIIAVDVVNDGLTLLQVHGSLVTISLKAFLDQVTKGGIDVIQV